MADSILAIDDAVERGELEAWKAALLKEWLLAGDASPAGPSPEALARLLVDPVVVARLRQISEGPWEALVAQARSLLAHEQVGRALEAVESE